MKINLHLDPVEDITPPQETPIARIALCFSEWHAFSESGSNLDYPAPCRTSLHHIRAFDFLRYWAASALTAINHARSLFVFQWGVSDSLMC